MRFVGLVIGLQLLCACSSSPAPSAPIAFDRAAAELDIMESVFRYQFAHNGAAYTHPDRYFLTLAQSTAPKPISSFERAVAPFAPRVGVAPEHPLFNAAGDPPLSLLARFQEHVPPVAPGSTADPDMWLGVHRRGEKDRGVLLRVTIIRWIDDTTVEVDGGYYASSRSASNNTYRVELKNGAWVVVQDTRHGVS